jgi:hypothetical protein
MNREDMAERSGKGRSIESVVERLREYLTGWKEYFQLADTPGIFTGLDQWIRRSPAAGPAQAVEARNYRLPRLLTRGVPEPVVRRACTHVYRWWLTSKHVALNMALPTSYYDRLGVPRLAP